MNSLCDIKKGIIHLYFKKNDVVRESRKKKMLLISRSYTLNKV